jgi:phosphorylcholine metabolism protein LicD
MAGKYTLEGKNAKIAVDMLQKVTDILDKREIKYWLEGGTLLGIIREDRLLPWDNDMDISLTEEYYDAILDAVDEIKKLGYMVWFKEFDSDNDPFKKGVKRIIKIRTRKLYFIRGEVALDIFIKFKKGNEYFWQVGEKRKSAPEHFYTNLREHKFNNKNYLVPKDCEEYLTFRYGEWQTPIKEWNTFRDDNAIKGDI